MLDLTGLRALRIDALSNHNIANCDLTQVRLELVGSREHVIDLSANYWGDPSHGSEVESRITHQSDDASRPLVVYNNHRGEYPGNWVFLIYEGAISSEEDGLLESVGDIEAVEFSVKNFGRTLVAQTSLNLFDPTYDIEGRREGSLIYDSHPKGEDIQIELPSSSTQTIRFPVRLNSDLPGTYRLLAATRKEPFSEGSILDTTGPSPFAEDWSQSAYIPIGEFGTIDVNDLDSEIVEAPTLLCRKFNELLSLLKNKKNRLTLELMIGVEGAGGIIADLETICDILNSSSDPNLALLSKELLDEIEAKGTSIGTPSLRAEELHRVIGTYEKFDTMVTLIHGGSLAQLSSGFFGFLFVKLIELELEIATELLNSGFRQISVQDEIADRYFKNFQSEPKGRTIFDPGIPYTRHERIIPIGGVTREDLIKFDIRAGNLSDQKLFTDIFYSADLAEFYVLVNTEGSDRDTESLAISIWADDSIIAFAVIGGPQDKPFLGNKWAAFEFPFDNLNIPDALEHGVHFEFRTLKDGEIFESRTQSLQVSNLFNQTDHDTQFTAAPTKDQSVLIEWDIRQKGPFQSVYSLIEINRDSVVHSTLSPSSQLIFSNDSDPAPVGTFVDSNVNFGTDYTYTLQAYDSNLKQILEESLQGTINLTVPPPPSLSVSAEAGANVLTAVSPSLKLARLEIRYSVDEFPQNPDQGLLLQSFLEPAQNQELELVHTPLKQQQVYYYSAFSFPVSNPAAFSSPTTTQAQSLDSTPPAPNALKNISALSPVSISIDSAKAEDDTKPISYTIEGQFLNSGIWNPDKGGVSSFDYTQETPRNVIDTDLLENGIYRYRQQVSDPLGNRSGWTDYGEINLPIASPTNGDVVVTGILDQGVSLFSRPLPTPSQLGRTGIEIHVTRLADRQVEAKIQHTPENIHFVPGLNPNTDYKVEFRFSNASGVWTPWNTDEILFTTFAIQPSPPILATSNTSTGSITIGADQNPPGTQYSILCKASSPNDPLWAGKWVGELGNPSSSPWWDTASKIDAHELLQLTNETTYEFVAVARNKNQIESPQSLPASITITGGDTDFDGMPDSWELLYSDPTTFADKDIKPLDPTSQDGHFDYDRDGHTNLQEYQAGTDPADSKDFLQLHARLEKDSTGKPRLVFRWIPKPNRTYFLLQTSGIESNGNWNSSDAIHIRENSHAEATIALTPISSPSFYRLAVSTAKP